jgi:hypothetical protein
LTQAEVRLAAHAWVMANGKFADAKTGGTHDCWEKGLHEIHREKRADDLATHRSQLTPAVV